MRLFVAKIDSTRLDILNGKDELPDISGTHHKIGAVLSVVYAPQDDQVFILFTSDGEVSAKAEPFPQQQVQNPAGTWLQPASQPSYRPQNQPYPQPQPSWQQSWGGGGPWNGVVS